MTGTLRGMGLSLRMRGSMSLVRRKGRLDAGVACRLTNNVKRVEVAVDMNWDETED